MATFRSFDVQLLGLRDPKQPGRTRFADAMHRLTARPAEEFHTLLSSDERQLFTALDRESTVKVAEQLGDAGVLIEIQPSTAPPSGAHEQMAPTSECPRCGFLQPAGGVECSRCGLVFAKFEREKVQKMQRDRTLEEALQKALQVREEWDHRAKQYLEGHPLPENALASFERELRREEIPFLRLVAEEGPILLTSRRMLISNGDTVSAIPYEMVSDIDVGGGLVQKRNRVRLALTFHGPLSIAGGQVKNVVVNLDKDSSFYKDVLMDWAFARSFICGSCGARELDFRLEDGSARVRCMHCATDHEIDLREAVAIPLVAE